MRNLDMSISQTMKRKEQIVSEMHGGLEFLMKKNKIKVIHGLGAFVDSNTVSVYNNKNTQNRKAKNIIIATFFSPGDMGPRA